MQAESGSWLPITAQYMTEQTPAVHRIKQPCIRCAHYRAPKFVPLDVASLRGGGPPERASAKFCSRLLSRVLLSSTRPLRPTPRSQWAWHEYRKDPSPGELLKWARSALLTLTGRPPSAPESLKCADGGQQVTGRMRVVGGRDTKAWLRSWWVHGDIRNGSFAGCSRVVACFRRLSLGECAMSCAEGWMGVGAQNLLKRRILIERGRIGNYRLYRISPYIAFHGSGIEQQEAIKSCNPPTARPGLPRTSTWSSCSMRCTPLTGPAP